MSTTTPSRQQPRPRRPPYWPFRIPARLGVWLRWIARAWLIAAPILFAFLTYRGAIPDVNIQLARTNAATIQLVLFGIVMLGVVLAWRWEAVGASVITVGAFALGVMAVIEHSLVHAFVIALIFVVPAFLYWLDWQRTRSLRALITFAAALSIALIAGGVGAYQEYQDRDGPAMRAVDELTGPTHPASILAKLPVTTVEWLWSGAQTETAITVNAALAHESDAVYLAVSQRSDMADPLRFGPATAEQAKNRVVSITATGLTPNTRYYFAIQADGEMDLSRQGQFRTLAPGAFSFTFAVGTGALTGSNGQVFDTIREWPRLLHPLRLIQDSGGIPVPQSEPLFYLMTGDLHYEDIAVNDPNAYRTAYETILTSPAQAALYRSMPIVYVWDDHDYGPNNADRTAPGRAAAQQVYRQLVPHYPLPAGDAAGAIYRAFTVGRVRFLVTDTRSERSPSADPDTAAKTMLGAEQKAWFKRELLAARDTASLIVWVSSVGWIGDPGATEDDWSGYATERRELADFIAQNQIKGLMMVSGDAHMVAIDNGANSDYATGGGAGFPVFHAASLDQIGSIKGGPYSEGTYPGGGQFGLVAVDDNGATVTVTMTGRTYRGDALVSHTFRVPAGRH